MEIQEWTGTDRNGPERTGMDWNEPEWTPEWTRMDSGMDRNGPERTGMDTGTDSNGHLNGREWMRN